MLRGKVGFSQKKILPKPLSFESQSAMKDYWNLKFLEVIIQNPKFRDTQICSYSNYLLKFWKVPNGKFESQTLNFSINFSALTMR